MPQHDSTWYAIRRLSPLASAARGVQAAAEIYIYGDIGESWWDESVSAAQFVRELNALDAQAITVRINSLGGSVPDGIAIYNAIKRHPATVTTVIDAMAMSVASLIAIAGDTVEMAENAVLMIHAPWTYMAGNSAQLRDMADQLDTWAQAMSTSYAAKSGMDQSAALALLTDGADHYYTAQEAQAAGFVDALTAALPVAASSRMDLSRFRDVPQAVAQRFGTADGAHAAVPAASPAASAATIPAAAAAPDADAIRAAALAADKQRRDAIGTAYARFADRDGVQALLKSCQDDHACSVQAAESKLLAHLGAQTTPVAGSIQTVQDEGDKRIQAGVQALMVRAGVARAEERRGIEANAMRGYTLLDMARASLARAGVRTDGMDKRQIVAAAFTQGGSDFPVLLEQAMHKTLQAGYATQPDTWSRFCATGSVSDFRAHNRYRVGSFGTLDAKTELNEFKNKAIPDGEKASITAGTKGNIISLSREAVINDDLGAFLGLAAALGRAARRTIEVDVYALLALNSGAGPTLSDGKALFHADHGNIGTGSAISMAGIDADRVLMASQKDVGGNDYLDLRPAVIVLPIGLGGTARSINSAEYDPDTANKLQKPNTVRGLFRDIVDTPRLSGTRRYLFADPLEAPVIEVAFLDGADTPYLEQEAGFDVDGSRWKVRMDYAVGAIDYRGAVTNAGA